MEMGAPPQLLENSLKIAIRQPMKPGPLNLEHGSHSRGKRVSINGNV
jgi:hypothetical protein